MDMRHDDSGTNSDLLGDSLSVCVCVCVCVSTCVSSSSLWLCNDRVWLLRKNSGLLSGHVTAWRVLFWRDIVCRCSGLQRDEFSISSQVQLCWIADWKWTNHQSWIMDTAANYYPSFLNLVLVAVEIEGWGEPEEERKTIQFELIVRRGRRRGI